jgi:adenine-specific DNA-methyltransferase
MSTNISKQKRKDLSDKIKAIHKYIARAKQDENTRNLLTWLSEIEREINGKKFGLVFEEHRESIDETLETHLPVLTENKKLFIDNGGQVNFLIEGDNLAALKLLLKTHKGKIDVIYIDPPYNTGAKDWKYDNDYVDQNDMFRHSKWLSFMQKRLELAKNLLAKKGVLICTIDKNEQANLGVLLNNLFADKEIVCVTILHNPGGIQGKNFSHTNEYAYFIHPKNGVFISTTIRDDVPPTAFRDWGKESAFRDAAKTCFYPILVQDEKIIGFGDICPDDFHPESANITRNDGITEVYPIDKNNIERKWRFGRETVNAIKNELFCKKIKGEYSIFRNKNDYRWKTVWTDTKYNANVYGTKLLGGILEAEFPYPKSLYAVIDCIKAVVHNINDATIIDFFAGSGTTGHAVLELNKQDGGKREFILCTNNENNICREVTYERIKRVIKNETYPASLKYYKIDYIPINDKLYYEYADKLLEHIRELVELENGINFIGDDKIAIVLTDEELDDFIRNIKNHKNCRKLYRAHNVLVSGKQAEILKSSRIKINVIPDYYYGDQEI